MVSFERASAGDVQKKMDSSFLKKLLNKRFKSIAGDLLVYVYECAKLKF